MSHIESIELFGCLGPVVVHLKKICDGQREVEEKEQTVAQDHTARETGLFTLADFLKASFEQETTVLGAQRGSFGYEQPFARFAESSKDEIIENDHQDQWQNSAHQS